LDFLAGIYFDICILYINVVEKTATKKNHCHSFDSFVCMPWIKVKAGQGKLDKSCSFFTTLPQSDFNCSNCTKRELRLAHMLLKLTR